MAARNRPRGAFVKDDPTDAHEERNMWSQIVTDIKRLRGTHARASEVAKLQVNLEAKMGNCECGSSQVDTSLCHCSAQTVWLHYCLRKISLRV